jgi:hypothetical protein
LCYPFFGNSLLFIGKFELNWQVELISIIIPWFHYKTTPPLILVANNIRAIFILCQAFSINYYLYPIPPSFFRQISEPIFGGGANVFAIYSSCTSPFSGTCVLKPYFSATRSPKYSAVSSSPCTINTSGLPLKQESHLRSSAWSAWAENPFIV